MRTDPSPQHPEFLTDEDLQLILFGGKGGVGKTSTACASAVAIARARPDARVLLVSTDPAHSVSDFFAGETPPENLRVDEFDADTFHERFMERHAATLHAIAARGTFLHDDDIAGLLDQSVPGVDELMAYMQIAEWLESDEADLVIVDTAPTGHTLRLLRLPELLARWIEAIDTMLAKHRYLSEVFAGSSGDELDDWLSDMTDRLGGLESLLEDGSRSRFVAVAAPEAMVVDETLDLLSALDELNISAPEVVLNRWRTGGDASLIRRQHAAARALREHLHGERAIWTLPILEREPIGVDGAEAIASSFVQGVPHEATPPSLAEAPAPPRLVGALDGDALRSRELLMFCGKGGVGKTTMSCATAAALAESGRRVLLVSTDPAGSLEDCLRERIGGTFEALAPRLRAVQLEAQREFDALREAYREEIEISLEALFGNLDAGFDREVLDRLLDLSPPGLDEVMALASITEWMDSGECDTLVLDTAPTGHLLRLLELPEIINGWLAQIFGLLLRYGDLLKMPRLEERLIRLSRGMKRFRTLLADGERASAVVVTLPTSLALAETRRLAERCGALGVSIDGLIINRLSESGAGAEPDPIAHREAGVLAEHEAAFPGSRRVCVYEGGDPRGLSALSRLGAGVLFGGAAALREAA